MQTTSFEILISLYFLLSPIPFFQVFIIPAIYATLQMWNNSPTTSHEICAIVYGGALIALFLVSTIFHVISMIDKTRFACLSICSKLTIEIPERRQWRRSAVFIVNFEHIVNSEQV